jgi:uncharacterized protein DUF2769
MERIQAEAECVCRMCPTYFDCGEPLAFCTWPQGKSRCIVVEQGCICPGCPVYVESEFASEGYYCVRGPEKAL